METLDSEIHKNLKTLLPLDLAERVVCWRNQEGLARRHIFQRITSHFWNAYFNTILIESDREGRTIDVNAAALWLYREAAIRAEGYAVRGGGSLMDLAHWQDRVPMGHRLQAIGLLSSVERSAEEIIEIEPDSEIIRLDALWGEDADNPSSMRKFTGLIHRFIPPTADHQQRFSREISRSLIVGGSRDGRTIHPIRQKVLARLYDDLIQSVEGYASKSAPLVVREDIVREMDVLHKVTAVGQLFSLMGEETPGEATEA